MPQPRNNPGKPLVIVCPDPCSFHPDKIGQKNADILRLVRQNGAGAPTFQRRAEELFGHRVPQTNVTRHLKHYRELVDNEPDPTGGGPTPNDLAILDGIIGAGFRYSKHWRPTIKDTLDAMKLKIQMTGQSAFEDMLRAMEVGLDLADGELDEEEPGIENPDAAGLPDEQGEDHGDDG